MLVWLRPVDKTRNDMKSLQFIVFYPVDKSVDNLCIVFVTIRAVARQDERVRRGLSSYYGLNFRIFRNVKSQILQTNPK